jgi:hypothetical protein
VSDHERPVFTTVNGTLMARRFWISTGVVAVRPYAFQAGSGSGRRLTYKCAGVPLAVL